MRLKIILLVGVSFLFLSCGDELGPDDEEVRTDKNAGKMVWGSNQWGSKDWGTSK